RNEISILRRAQRVNAQQRRARDQQILFGFEDHVFKISDADFCPLWNQNVVGSFFDQVKGERYTSSFGGRQIDSEQIEESQKIFFRHAVELLNDDFTHPRCQLEQSHSKILRVVRQQQNGTAVLGNGRLPF